MDILKRYGIYNSTTPSVAKTEIPPTHTPTQAPYIQLQTIICNVKWTNGSTVKLQFTPNNQTVKCIGHDSHRYTGLLQTKQDIFFTTLNDCFKSFFEIQLQQRCYFGKLLDAFVTPQFNFSEKIITTAFRNMNSLLDTSEELDTLRMEFKSGHMQ